MSLCDFFWVGSFYVAWRYAIFHWGRGLTLVVCVTLIALAGVYPLKMRVVGILEATHSADDLAVFVALKTAWVVQGLVHGHRDLTEVTDPTLVMDGSDGSVTATAKLTQYTEITPGNLGSFHFHGDAADYPITSVIAIPRDDKAGAILRGRYLGAAEDNARQDGMPSQQIQVQGGLWQVCSPTSFASRAFSMR